MTNRFDLEQSILKCWNVTTDIKDMCEADAPVEHIKALHTVYEYHFENLWKIFETMVRTGAM